MDTSLIEAYAAAMTSQPQMTELEIIIFNQLKGKMIYTLGRKLKLDLIKNSLNYQPISIGIKKETD